MYEEPESPKKGGLCKIYGEPESPNAGSCLGYMMNTYGHMRGGVQDT